ncbi:MAG TPA: hypothetical protein VNM90_05820 [Haliangium sp.]|nr:hypothetical protein [Haliangium sp.]
MRKRVIAGVGALVAAACSALAIGMLRARQAVPRPTPAAVVPSTWHDVRDSAGHQVHVAELGLACRDCHAIATAGFAPPRAICGSCHAEVETPLHGSILGRSSTECQDCHGFGADLGVRPGQCMRCHAQPQGFVAAVALHGDQDCSACHRAHAEPTLAPQACEGCHAGQQPRHGRAGRAAAAACLDCHDMHSRTAAARRCVACHQAIEPRVPASATFPGHDTCTGCHPAHDFSRRGGAACTSCHREQNTLGVSDARSGARPDPRGAGAGAGTHAMCASCHRSHDVRNPVPCTACHASVRTTHPTDAAQRPCLGCHPIHPDAATSARLHGPVLACSACHAQSAHAAGTACADCHQAHGALQPVASASLCSGCHQTIVATVAGSGHAPCQGCHVQAAHAPATPVPACSQCHADVAGRVAAGHASCAQCHAGAAHAPAIAPPACETCHREQRASAPAGHLACAQCHDPHVGSVRAQVTCGDCHARERDTGHGARMGCAACHRPHGPGGVPAPPACSQCHESAALPGMHRAHSRATCSDCHRSHESAPRADRAACTACHRDLDRHEPTTNVCTGCHGFRR